jgi:hypothetical protein
VKRAGYDFYINVIDVSTIAIPISKPIQDIFKQDLLVLLYIIMSTNQSTYQDNDTIVPQEQHHQHHHHHQNQNQLGSNSAGLGSSNEAGYLEDGQQGQERMVPQTGEPMKDHGIISHLLYVI